MRLKVIMLFFIFIIINVAVSGVDMTYEPFYILESIMIPVENNVIVFSRLILNYTIALIIIYVFINNCHNIYGMYPFIASRNKKKGVVKLYGILSLKQLGIILFVKLIADLCTNNISGLINFSILIKIYTSIFLTAILWMIIVFLFYALFQNEKKSYFPILVLVFISQFLALKNSVYGIFSMTYINFYLNFVILTILKTLFIIIFLILTIYIFNKKEFIGGAKND